MQSTALKEEITSQGIIVYHRTGSHDESYRLVLPVDGFRPENWSFYGKGVYTCLSPQQVDSPEFKKNGPLVVESKVTSVEGFLCLIPDLVSKLFRTELTLPEQVAKILGVSAQAIQADPVLNDEIQKLSTVAQGNPDEVGQSLKFVAPKIYSKLKGIITNDPKLGPSLIAFNPQTLIPVKYKIDGATEWKNAGGTRDFYEKLKSFYQQKSQTAGELNPNASYEKNDISLPLDEVLRYATLLGYTNTQPSEDMKVIMSKDERVKKAYYAASQRKQVKPAVKSPQMATA